MAEVIPPRRKFGANLQPQQVRESAPKDTDSTTVWLDRAKETFDKYFKWSARQTTGGAKEDYKIVKELDRGMFGTALLVS